MVLLGCLALFEYVHFHSINSVPSPSLCHKRVLFIVGSRAVTIHWRTGLIFHLTFDHLINYEWFFHLYTNCVYFWTVVVFPSSDLVWLADPYQFAAHGGVWSNAYTNFVLSSRIWRSVLIVYRLWEGCGLIIKLKFSDYNLIRALSEQTFISATVNLQASWAEPGPGSSGWAVMSLVGLPLLKPESTLITLMITSSWTLLYLSLANKDRKFPGPKLYF